MSHHMVDKGPHFGEGHRGFFGAMPAADPSGTDIGLPGSKYLRIDLPLYFNKSLLESFFLRQK